MWKVDEQQETKIDKKLLEYLILTFGIQFFVLFSLLKMHILIDNDNNCQKGKQ